MFGPKFDQFREDARAWMTPERAIAMQGIGQGLSQLAMGQAPNLSPAYQAIAERQKAAQMREALQGSGIMDRFTPDQQAVLAQMEPAAAQSIIMQTLFAPPPPPVKGTEINGQLINPVTGEVMGDYRSPNAPEPIIVNDQIINPETYEVVGDYRDEDAPSTGYIATGDAAAALGLNPSQAYNITVEDGNMRATQIGGGGTTVNIGSEVGTIPQGYELYVDPETEARRLRAIPGGPADTSEKDVARAGALSKSSSVVTAAASRALGAARSRSVSGVLGAMASVNPQSENAEVYRQVEALKSISAVEAINAMRQQSPTGGALGNASDRDIALLKEQGGALDPASPNFERDLQDYVRALLRTIHGKEAGDEVFEAELKDQFQEKGEKPPLSRSQLFEKYGIEGGAD